MLSLTRNLAKLIGQDCWKAVGGRGNGSMVTFQFGKKIAPKSSPYGGATVVDRRSSVDSYKGEFCLFIKGCSWRLGKLNATLCTWRDTEDTIASCVKNVEGCRVLDVAILNPGNDLKVQFEQDYVLELFCDQSETADGAMENYAMRFQEMWFSFGPGGIISQE